MANIPDTVADESARELYDLCNVARAEIKAVADRVDVLRRSAARLGQGEGGRGETIANVTLAYRHLEDASMRLGKALQALDGGVSVYDRATTVGA